VFVVLSYDPTVSVPEFVEVGRKKLNRSKKRKVTAEEAEAAEAVGDLNRMVRSSSSSEPVGPSIFDSIPPSRTFLCTVSYSTIVVEVNTLFINSISDAFPTHHLTMFFS